MSRTSARTQQAYTQAAASQAAQLVGGRRTCEGCAHLRIHPRPMCAGDQSPHERTPRETYHERWGWYQVKGRERA